MPYPQLCAVFSFLLFGLLLLIMTGVSSVIQIPSDYPKSSHLRECSGTSPGRHTFEHTGPVTSTSINHDNTMLASGSEFLKTWDPTSGDELHTFNGANDITSVSFSGDGSLLASSSTDTVKVWNATTAELLWDFVGLSESVVETAISRDGYYVASCSENILKVWNLMTGEVALDSSSSYGCQQVGFSPDSTKLTYLFEGLYIYDIASGTQETFEPGLEIEYSQLFYSFNCDFSLVLQASTKELVGTEVATGAPLSDLSHFFEFTGDRLASVAFSNQNSFFATVWEVIFYV